MMTSVRNRSLLNQITYMHLKGLITHFQKMILFIMQWLTVSEILGFEVKDILLYFCWVGIFFDILIANISWTVAQTTINHINFWKSIMSSFRCIYVNCFNRLRFLTEVSTKLQKSYFFGQFKDHNSQVTPFFSSSFSALTDCNIHFCIWK